MVKKILYFPNKKTSQFKFMIFNNRLTKEVVFLSANKKVNCPHSSADIKINLEVPNHMKKNF